MTGLRDNVRRRLRRFAGTEDGTAMVEFGVVVGLFFLLFYAALDFGRLSYSKVLVTRAAEAAARVAIVRPAACAGVPETHVRGPVPNNTIPPRFGTSCNAGPDVCAAVATVSCTKTAMPTNCATPSDTLDEIWCRIAPLVPSDATIGDVTVTYTHDGELGFLGGPYTPIVTVDLNLPDFQFVGPIGPLLTLVTGSSSFPASNSISYGKVSVSLPAEDLNNGEDG